MTINPTGLAEEAWREVELALRTIADYPGDLSDISALNMTSIAKRGLKHLLAAQARHEAEVGELADKHDYDLGEVIDERDEAIEAVSQAYYLIVGRSPEWSNLFGVKQALEDIDDAQSILRETGRTAAAVHLQAEVAELVEGLRVFVRHGGAMGAFGDDPGPFQYYTQRGYREVRATDFEQARALVAKHDRPKDGGEG
jgi:hypothetical protein